MKTMNVAEMQKVNGGVLFSTLCSWALFGWGVSCAASTAQKILNKGKKKSKKRR